MAEDKKIRVSTDVTPLQEIRQAAQALWNDLGNMESSYKQINDRVLETIRTQINLLKERNTLYNEIPPIASNRREIVQPDQNRQQASKDQPVSPDASAIYSQLEPNERQNSVLEEILKQSIRIAEFIEHQGRNEENGILPGTSETPQPSLPSPSGESPTKPPKSPTSSEGGGFKLPSMSSMMNMLPFAGLIMSIGSAIGKQAQFNATQYSAENAFQRENNIGNHWLLSMLTFGVSSAEAQKREIARIASQGNDRALRDYSSLFGTSYEESFANQVQESYTPEQIDAYGKVEEYENKGLGSVGRAIKMASTSSIMGGGSAYLQEQVGKELAEDTERKNEAKKAEKAFGDTVGEMQTWASRTLGITMDEYLSKFTALSRAGVFAENTDPRDIEQLMLSGRIRGLSEEDQANVLRTTRFSNDGTTGADVVQTFDTNLQARYGNPQTVAAMLPEMIQSFNKIGNNLLDRVGSINGGNILQSMTSIQNATGMQGRQLERVQNALMGNNVSQDDVTQALLLRTANEINGGNGNLSDLQALIERMGEEPKLQQQFYDKIKNMTGGGETMRQVMKAVFPTLSMNDIIDLETATGNDAEKIWGEGIKRGAAYSDEQAARTVGPAEASSAATQNKKIMDGYSQLFEKLGTSIKEVLQNAAKPIPVMVVNEPKKELSFPLPFERAEFTMTKNTQ